MLKHGGFHLNRPVIPGVEKYELFIEVSHNILLIQSANRNFRLIYFYGSGCIARHLTQRNYIKAVYPEELLL